MSSAAGSFRFSTIERLLRLLLTKEAVNPPRRLAPWRVESPSGASTLMMSAPWSPRIIVASGPATFEVRSTTRIPARGPGIGGPFDRGQTDGRARHYNDHSESIPRVAEAAMFKRIDHVEIVTDKPRE